MIQPNSRVATMTGLYSARVTFPEHPEEILDLDFEPIIKTFNLQKLNKFVLCHWQSRPRGTRGYGFYDFATRNYHCIDWDRVRCIALQPKFLQIDETANLSAPTAVICFENRSLNFNNNIWQVE